MNAATYARVSTEEQDEKNQLATCRDYIKEQDMDEVGLYADHGLSAWKENQPRPQFEKLLKDAKAGKFKHIVVFDMSRITRQGAAHILRIIYDMQLVGVQVHSATGGALHSATAMFSSLNESARKINDPAMSSFLEAQAKALYNLVVGVEAEADKMESLKKSLRVKAKIAQQKKDKVYCGGAPSLPDEAIERVKELLEQGNTPYAISVKEMVTYKTPGGKTKHVSKNTAEKIRKSMKGGQP